MMNKWIAIVIVLFREALVEAEESKNIEELEYYHILTGRISQMENPGFRSLGVNGNTLEFNLGSVKYVDTFQKTFKGVNKYTGGNMYSFEYDFSRSSSITAIFNQHAELEVVLRAAHKDLFEQILSRLKRIYHFVSDESLSDGSRLIMFEAVETKIYLKSPKSGNTIYVEYIHDNFQKRYDEVVAVETLQAEPNENLTFDYAEALLSLKQRHCLQVWPMGEDLSIFTASGEKLHYRSPGLCVEPQWLTINMDTFGYKPHVQRVDLTALQTLSLYRHRGDLPAVRPKILVETPIDPRTIPVPEMISVTAGSYNVGCQVLSDECKDTDKSLQEVQVEGFYLGETEVTVEQYDHYCSREPSCRRHGGESEHPVKLKLDSAQAYINWLRQHTGKPYRLPTELEWEYAARAGATTTYSWGNKESGSQANGRQGHDNYVVRNLQQKRGDKLWPEDGYKKRAPVKSYSPNAWGFYQMLGNAAEWCVNGVLRGGSWRGNPEALHLSSRDSEPVLVDAGLRLAMDR